jgi:uncharacterized protein YgbK (DUF1537 family)
MLLAAIADDFTGGTDLAGMLAEEGARTVLSFGAGPVPTSYDAAVACLKSRSIRAADAVSHTLEALDALLEAKPRQIYFKYCSTFDSTQHGNIGPVCDALLRSLESAFTVAVPSLPVNGRTQYQGYLFVDGVPLAESPMRDHPLNPMTDSNLVRWLQRQTGRKIGLLRLTSIVGDLEQEAVRLQSDGVEIALADVITNRDLDAIAGAFAEQRLLTGGSGLGMALAKEWRRRAWIPPARRTKTADAFRGKALILAGSCSPATLAQLERFGGSQIRVDPAALLNDPEKETGRALREIRRQLRSESYAIVRSSATAEEREATGLDARIVAEELETMFGVLAATLSGEVRRIIVAGGETAGAVTAALGVESAEVGRLIDPGVPLIRPLDGIDLDLVLKSGNFGSRDFFAKALEAN